MEMAIWWIQKHQHDHFVKTKKTKKKMILAKKRVMV